MVSFLLSLIAVLFGGSESPVLPAAIVQGRHCVCGGSSDVILFYPRAEQVDFADQYLGGLSMFGGHIAQEELLFIVYPELHVVMLFSDVMKTSEAVVIKGVERFVFFEGSSP